MGRQGDIAKLSRFSLTFAISKKVRPVSGLFIRGRQVRRKVFCFQSKELVSFKENMPAFLTRITASARTLNVAASTKLTTGFPLGGASSGRARPVSRSRDSCSEPVLSDLFIFMPPGRPNQVCSFEDRSAMIFSS